MDPTRRLIHRRLSNFVIWIKPDEDRVRTTREQANRLREEIRAKATDDGLIIQSTPQGGSLAKATGLRRHITGGSDVEGMDVDLHFVVQPTTEEEEQLDELLHRFERYVKACYPDKPVERTKSSVKLSFVGTKLSYDVVPLLATEADDEQILIRRDGVRIHTSVQRHVAFIKARSRQSDQIAGRVRFNECIRLMKWWREFKVDEAMVYVPSLALDLLCAAAFDVRGVQKTYHETLADWFGWIGDAVRRRVRICFSDFTMPLAPVPGAAWELIDPVNPANNLADRWQSWQIDVLATCFEEGRDVWARAVRADLLGQDAESLRHLGDLFGSPFKNHCEGD